MALGKEVIDEQYSLGAVDLYGESKIKAEKGHAEK